MDIAAYTDELKRSHWDLLLEADPWFEAVQKYLPPRNPDAEVFLIGRSHAPYALCVTVPIKDGLEIKNIATQTIMRRQGMASALIGHVIGVARERGLAAVEIGTGETSREQIRLYEKIGFKRDGVLPGYFLQYPEPIIENGQLLKDMVMLRLEFSPSN